MNNKDKEYSCFTLKQLKEIGKAMNKSGLFEIISTSRNKKELYLSIKNELKDICNTETCWIDQKFINNISDNDILNKIKYFTYKPVFESGGDYKRWLSNIDINNVMKQMLYNRNDVFYLGALPSDIHRLYKLDYKKMKTPKKTLIVFNTDPHNKKGEHWVAVCIDNKRYIVEYFDSVAHKPNKYIREFLENFKEYKLKTSSSKHQLKDSECGMFVLYYCYLKLKDKQIEEIDKMIITDDYVNASRQCFFNIQ